MAEETKEEQSGGGEKKSSKMLLIIIIAVLILILVIGGLVAFLMMNNTQDPSPQAQQQSTAVESGDSAAEQAPIGSGPMTEVGIMYPLDTFTVNLLSENGRRYLKVELNLEIDGEELTAELDSKKPVLRDIIIRLLSSKTLEEISTIKGKDKLKEQIVSEINMRLKDGRIKNVYFVDFVVQ